MAPLMRGIDAEKYDRAYSDRDLVARIIGYFRPHRRKVLVIVVAMRSGRASRPCWPCWCSSPASARGRWPASAAI